MSSYKPAETIGPVERVLTSPVPASKHVFSWQSIYERMSMSDPIESRGDRKKFMDDAIAAERSERAKAVDVPHDYDLLKRQASQYESELRASEELNRKWSLDYTSLSEECAEAKRERDEAKAALDNECQFFAVNQHTIEAQKDEIERLTNETSLLRVANNKAAMLEREVARLESELANCLSSPVTSQAVPREAIAWLIGWLNCDLSTQSLNDLSADECRQRVATVDAWLSGGAK